jgi:hypothetical protein
MAIVKFSEAQPVVTSIHHRVLSSGLHPTLCAHVILAGLLARKSHKNLRDDWSGVQALDPPLRASAGISFRRSLGVSRLDEYNAEALRCARNEPNGQMVDYDRREEPCPGRPGPVSSVVALGSTRRHHFLYARESSPSTITSEMLFRGQLHVTVQDAMRKRP